MFEAGEKIKYLTSFGYFSTKLAHHIESLINIEIVQSQTCSYPTTANVQRNIYTVFYFAKHGLKSSYLGRKLTFKLNYL
jgi:hypothetical protein